MSGFTNPNSGLTDRGSLVEFAYRTLRERIAKGLYVPGARITEEAVATDLDVSRAPVREAMRMLTAEGILAARPRGGVTVPALNKTELAELFGARASLQSSMVFAATTVAAPGDLARLRELAGGSGVAAKSAESMDDAFFEAIGQVAGNGWMLRLHAQVGAQLERYRRDFPSTWTNAQHGARRTEIVNAMAERDGVGAAQLTSKYVDDLLFVMLSSHEEAADL